METEKYNNKKKPRIITRDTNTHKTQETYNDDKPKT